MRPFRSWSLGTKLVAAFLLVVGLVTGLGYGLIKLSVDRALADLSLREGRAYDQWVRTLVLRFRGLQVTVEQVVQVLEGAPRPLGFVLADPQGRVVVSRDRSLLGKTLTPRELATGTPIELADGTRWTLVPLPRVPPNPLHDQFMEAVNRSLWAAAAVVGALALVLAWILVRHFTGPLRRLEAAAGRIAQGDLGVRVEERGDDELGRLSQSFNAMAQSLERAEQAKRQLIADVAHELRTPIAVLRAAVEGFEDGILEPNPENLSALKDRLHLTARLIDDLQQLALADAGQLTLRSEKVPLADLIEDIASLIQPQLEDSGISLSIDIPPGLPPVRGDRGRIEQVLLNLFSNALRHTPPGGRITVAILPKGPEVEVIVADTGSGIPPGNEERIFERFYRGPNAPPGVPGSGLGLAVAKAIVEAHRGRIWAENRLEGGAAFHFTLPLDSPTPQG